MPQTDIVRARAIRRAGHACEVCGTPVRLRSACFLDVQPLDVQPVPGALLEAEECCVLCQRCFDELDSRGQAEGSAGLGASRGEQPTPGDHKVVWKEDMQQATRKAWFADDDPDGGICA